MLRLWLVGLALLLASGTARADDEFDAHYEQARVFEKNEQLLDAVKELQAAYALRQPPILLYDLGRLEQRLGHPRQALDYYGRFLATGAASGELSSQVSAQVKELHRVVAATELRLPVLPSDVRLVPVRLETHHDRGLVGGGLTLLITGYTAALITGSVFLGIVNPTYDKALYDASGTLLIPVLGPFVSGFMYLQSFWAAPWMIVDGAAQVAGLALTIVGFRRTHKVPVFTDQLGLAPYSTATGGGLVLRGRF